MTPHLRQPHGAIVQQGRRPARTAMARTAIATIAIAVASFAAACSSDPATTESGSGTAATGAASGAWTFTDDRGITHTLPEAPDTIAAQSVAADAGDPPACTATIHNAALMCEAISKMQSRRVY